MDPRWLTRQLLSLAMLAALCAPAAAEIVTFPDPNLEAAVRAKLGIPSPTPVNSSDMAGMTGIQAPMSGISNLGGLQWASSMRYMDLGRNQVTDLAPISGLMSLRNILLQSNLISDLAPLSGLSGVWELEFAGNQISEIGPLSGMVALTTLGLGGNRIADIAPLSGLTQIWDLMLYANEIVDVSPLAGLTNLRVVGLSSNDIEDISPLAGLTHLRDLDLRHNPLNPDAYQVYIPLILANNPGVDLLYDPVPEPGTLCMLCLGACGCLARLRSRRKHGPRGESNDKSPACACGITSLRPGNHA